MESYDRGLIYLCDIGGIRYGCPGDFGNTDIGVCRVLRERGMRWNKITIETTTAAEDMVSYELAEMGFEGVEIEDHVPLTQEELKEFPPIDDSELTPEWLEVLYTKA